MHMFKPGGQDHPQSTCQFAQSLALNTLCQSTMFITLSSPALVVSLLTALRNLTLAELNSLLPVQTGWRVFQANRDSVKS